MNTVASPAAPPVRGAQVTEEALVFPCAGESLLGIVSSAGGGDEQGGSELGVVIIVGGPQYRAGSHRQFVQLARALARAGLPALRFDYRGMGDSEGALHQFEQVADDIAAAIAALQRARPAVRRVVLWGLCDAASAALLYLQARPDPRVCGLALLNPWVRSEASLARTHVKHYYRQRLQDPQFWLKLVRGGVAWQALGGLLRNLKAARGGAKDGADQGSRAARQLPYQQRMAAAWAAFKGPILLLMSGDDYTAREFADHAGADPAWQQAFRKRPPTRVDLPEADHTCSTPGAKAAAEAATLQWLQHTPGLTRQAAT